MVEMTAMMIRNIREMGLVTKGSRLPRKTRAAPSRAAPEAKTGRKVMLISVFFCIHRQMVELTTTVRTAMMALKVPL